MYTSWPYYPNIMQINVISSEYLFLYKALCHQIRAHCKLSLGFYSTITEPVISKTKMQIMYYHQTHSLSTRVMPFMQKQKVLGLMGRRKKGEENRLLTENCTRDWKGLVNRTNNTCLSPCNYGFHYTSMHLSQAVTTPLSIFVNVRIQPDTAVTLHHTHTTAEKVGD